MHPDALNEFIEMAHQTLEQVARIEAKVGDVHGHDASEPTHEHCVLVGVSGDLSGSIALEFDTPLALRLASGILGKQSVEINARTEAALVEFANIIVGTALTALDKDERGSRIDITPPTLMMQTKAREGEFLPAAGEAVAVPFACDAGRLNFIVSLSKRTR